MPVLQQIKIGRLMLAIVITLLIADAAPRTNLSAGISAGPWNVFDGLAMAEETASSAIADSPQ